MCIAVVILNYSEQFPLIVAHNREEDIMRRTSKLLVKENILAAFDLRAGGVAAVGMNVESGTFAVLTNCRKAGSFNPLGESRGAYMREVLTDRNPDMRGRTFQGDFHMLTGNAFIDEIVNLRYVTSLNTSFFCKESFTDGKELKIFVLMNQFDLSQRDWQPKNEYIKESLYYCLRAHPELRSAPELMNVVLSVLSQTGEILPYPACECAWSPNPDAERHMQRCIIVPPTRLGDSCIFGTVSQTIFVTDKLARRVLYRYREVTSSESAVTSFAEWEERVISY